MPHINKISHSSGFPGGFKFWYYFDDLAQDCSNYIANALELPQFCAKPAISKLEVYRLFDVSVEY